MLLPPYGWSYVCRIAVCVCPRWRVWRVSKKWRLGDSVRVPQYVGARVSTRLPHQSPLLALCRPRHMNAMNQSLDRICVLSSVESVSCLYICITIRILRKRKMYSSRRPTREVPSCPTACTLSTGSKPYEFHVSIKLDLPTQSAKRQFSVPKRVPTEV